MLATNQCLLPYNIMRGMQKIPKNAEYSMKILSDDGKQTETRMIRKMSQQTA